MTEGTDKPNNHRQPWYAAAVTDTLTWVRGHGVGFFLLLLLLGLLTWSSVRDDKVRLTEIERRLNECEADRKSLREILDKIVNSSK